MKWRLVAAFTVLVTGVLLTQDIPLASYIRTIEEGRVFADLERDAFILAGGAVRTLELDVGNTAAARQSRDGRDAHGSVRMSGFVFMSPRSFSRDCGRVQPSGGRWLSR